MEQSDIATNSTTTSLIVENGVVSGIIDGASQLNPTSPGPTQAQIDERNDLENELSLVRADMAGIEGKITNIQNQIEALQNAIARTNADSGKYYNENYAERVAEIFVPIDVYEAGKEQRNRENDTYVRDATARLNQLKEEIAQAKLDLSELEREENSLTNRLNELPGDPVDVKPVDPEELGDGESIPLCQPCT
ncbi:MAG: hypothetical protein HEP70_20515, partial [Rhodobiaceae bacterium]|nr:hypothetical protein [Rhodobiaceae bacterium]